MSRHFRIVDIEFEKSRNESPKRSGDVVLFYKFKFHFEHKDSSVHKKLNSYVEVEGEKNIFKALEEAEQKLLELEREYE